jgi:hypothetical protein
MQDKSSYSSPNKPQISEGLQNYINDLVQSIVIKGENVDNSKKWLKKFIENESLDYNEYETNFADFLELIEDYHKFPIPAKKKILSKQAEICFISTGVFEKLINVLFIYEEPPEEPKKYIYTDYYKNEQVDTFVFENRAWQCVDLDIYGNKTPKGMEIHKYGYDKWRIPSKEDWLELFKFVGSNKDFLFGKNYLNLEYNCRYWTNAIHSEGFLDSSVNKLLSSDGRSITKKIFDKNLLNRAVNKLVDNNSLEYHYILLNNYGEYEFNNWEATARLRLMRIM